MTALDAPSCSSPLTFYTLHTGAPPHPALLHLAPPPLARPPPARDGASWAQHSTRASHYASYAPRLPTPLISGQPSAHQSASVTGRSSRPALGLSFLYFVTPAPRKVPDTWQVPMGAYTRMNRSTRDHRAYRARKPLIPRAARVPPPSCICFLLSAQGPDAPGGLPCLPHFCACAQIPLEACLALPHLCPCPQSSLPTQETSLQSSV